MSMPIQRLYNIEVQMADRNEVTDKVQNMIRAFLEFPADAIDEVEAYNLTATYISTMKIEQIKEAIRSLFSKCPGIHYIDVIYRYKWEMTPDRFVMWHTGQIQEYKSKVIYEEVDQ